MALGKWRRRRSGAAPASEPQGAAPAAASVGGATDRGGLVRIGIAGTAVLLAAALLALVNYFGWKYHQRFDWTESQLYTLSQKTESVLAALDREVDVYVFLDPQDQLFEPTRELLARYEAASSRLAVRMVDPAKNLVETERLIERFEVDRAAVVFASGDDKRVVPRNDLAELDFTTLQFGGEEPEVEAFRGEQRFTRALIDLAEAEPPRVLFTVGHGELRLDDRGQQGLAELQQVLGTDNFQIDEWASLGEERVPEDADLVVIAGPSSSFLPPELAMLDAYLEGGGALLVLLDSPVEGGEEAGGGKAGAAEPEAGEGADGGTAGPGATAGGAAASLTAWLAGYGVEVGDDTVIDPQGTLPFYGAGTFFVSRYPAEHPITTPLAGDELPVLLSLARSVGPGEAPSGLTAETLLASSAEAWGETDPSELVQGPEDTRGPVSLGVVVQRAAEEVAEEDVLAEDGGEDFLAEAGADAEEEGGEAGGADGMRLAVYGDSAFVTDQFLGNYGNTALVSSTVNWLTAREALVAIPPRAPESSRLEITGSELRWLYLLALVLLPGAGLVAGALVWYRRRR